MTKEKPQISIIMGSDSDLPSMQEAAKVLDELDVTYELTIVSAHRTPERLYEYAQSATKRGLKVIIAGAGGAAHLPGMIASMVTLPVIGVPIKTRSLGGLDSLLSIVQMPPGVPVATVAIGGAKNAGLLAAQILAVENDVIRDKISTYKKDLNRTVLQKAQKLEEIGFSKYLKKNE